MENENISLFPKCAVIVLIALLFGLIANSLCFAQSYFLVYSGINSPSAVLPNESSGFLNFNWDKGINLGVSIYFKITNNIYFSPNFEYNYYKYDSFNEPLITIPEVNLKAAEGEDSHIYRISLETRYITPKQVKPQLYLLTGFGYVFEDIGNIRLHWESMFDPDCEFETERKYNGKNYLVHTLGIGLKISVYRKIALNIEAKYFTNYKDRFQNSLNIGLLYSFNSPRS